MIVAVVFYLCRWCRRLPTCSRGSRDIWADRSCRHKCVHNPLYPRRRHRLDYYSNRIHFARRQQRHLLLLLLINRQLMTSDSLNGRRRLAIDLQLWMNKWAWDQSIVPGGNKVGRYQLESSSNRSRTDRRLQRSDFHQRRHRSMPICFFS